VLGKSCAPLQIELTAVRQSSWSASARSKVPICGASPPMKYHVLVLSCHLFNLYPMMSAFIGHRHLNRRCQQANTCCKEKQATCNKRGGLVERQQGGICPAGNMDLLSTMAVVRSEAWNPNASKIQTSIVPGISCECIGLSLWPIFVLRRMTHAMNCTV